MPCVQYHSYLAVNYPTASQLYTKIALAPLHRDKCYIVTNYFKSLQFTSHYLVTDNGVVCLSLKSCNTMTKIHTLSAEFVMNAV